MKRRAFVSLVACLLMAKPAFAGPQHVEKAARPLPRGATAASLPQTSIADLSQKYVKDGESAAVLIDVASGEVLEVYRPSVPMPPASVTKVVTTLFGIDRLGAHYQFTTRVRATGPVQNGIVQGDLILEGSGDPALDSDELAAMIKEMREAGIKGITGRFYYDDRALPYLWEIDAGQPVEAAYNPSVSGLNLNFNRVHLEWGKGNGLSVKARAERHAPDVASVRIVTEDRSGPIYHYEEKGGADHWSLAAPALKRPGATWLPVRKPAPYAAEAFRSLAHYYGLLLPYPERRVTPVEGQVLARKTRRELKLLCRSMLHFSTNLTAEAIGLTASNAGGLKTSAAAMSSWAETRYGLTNMSFVDHSGLGDLNRITAGDMAAMVAEAQKNGRLDGLLRRYFVQSRNGKTAALEGAEVRAKTGTLNYVRGLSGVITGRKGQELAFAIFSSDLEARAKIDGTQARQPGASRFGKRAHAFEQAVLRRWMNAFAR